MVDDALHDKIQQTFSQSDRSAVLVDNAKQIVGGSANVARMLDSHCLRIRRRSCRAVDWTTSLPASTTSGLYLKRRSIPPLRLGSGETPSRNFETG